MVEIYKIIYGLLVTGTILLAIFLMIGDLIKRLAEWTDDHTGDHEVFMGKLTPEILYRDGDDNALYYVKLFTWGFSSIAISFLWPLILAGVIIYCAAYSVRYIRRLEKKINEYQKVTNDTTRTKTQSGR